MSIILKGIDIPKETKEMCVMYKDKEGYLQTYIVKDIIQIPNGVRLIDANAMLKDLRRRICNRVPVYKDEDVDVVISEIVKQCQIDSEIRTLGEWISSQPVILESEEEKWKEEQMQK